MRRQISCANLRVSRGVCSRLCCRLGICHPGGPFLMFAIPCVGSILLPRKGSTANRTISVQDRQSRTIRRTSGGPCRRASDATLRRKSHLWQYQEVQQGYGMAPPSFARGNTVFDVEVLGTADIKSLDHSIKTQKVEKAWPSTTM